MLSRSTSTCWSGRTFRLAVNSTSCGSPSGPNRLSLPSSCPLAKNARQSCETRGLEPGWAKSSSLRPMMRPAGTPSSLPAPALASWYCPSLSTSRIGVAGRNTTARNSSRSRDAPFCCNHWFAGALLEAAEDRSRSPLPRRFRLPAAWRTREASPADRRKLEWRTVQSSTGSPGRIGI